MTRVLVPLDGSRLSRKAIDVVVRSFGTEAEITLFTSVQVPEIPVYGYVPIMPPEVAYKPPLETLRHDATGYLQEIAEHLREQGYTVNTRIEIGEPAQAITQAANALDVDMIVMSTHGRSGISRLLFGSVTNRVLSMAECPVLVVPSRDMAQEAQSPS